MFLSKYVLWLFVFISVILFSNCSDSSEPETISEDVLIPLKVGNTWNYKRTDFDSTGTIISTANDTRIIDKDTTISNLKWYSYQGFPDMWWYTNKSDGHWVFIKAGSNSLTKDTSLTIYKYPTQVGDIYNVYENSIEVLETNKEITVPAGTFKVIHLINNYNDLYFTNCIESYIAPNIGVIKYMQIGKKENGDKFVIFQSELESYTLK